MPQKDNSNNNNNNKKKQPGMSVLDSDETETDPQAKRDLSKKKRTKKLQNGASVEKLCVDIH